VFAPAVLSLASVWSAVDYYSHGFLVPVVSVLIASSVQRERARLPRVRDRRGALLLAGALALYVAGLGAGTPGAQGLALVAAIAGAVWFLRGAAWLRALAFPIAFLLFMVPIPPTWLAPLIVGLLGFVTATSVGLLQAFGVPVAREGNVILLPGGETLFVAEACSGLTSLVTLTPIAVLIAWLTPLPLRARALLVASVVPIAMGANLLRVVGTVAGARWLGVGAVTGEPAHTGFGLGVYLVASLALLGVAGLLRRLERGGPPARPARLRAAD
jgi:exosortase